MGREQRKGAASARRHECLRARSASATGVVGATSGRRQRLVIALGGGMANGRRCGGAATGATPIDAGRRAGAYRTTATSRKRVGESATAGAPAQAPRQSQAPPGPVSWFACPPWPKASSLDAPSSCEPAYEPVCEPACEPTSAPASGAATVGAPGCAADDGTAWPSCMGQAGSATDSAVKRPKSVARTTARARRQPGRVTGRTYRSRLGASNAVRFCRGSPYHSMCRPRHSPLARG